MLLSVEQLYLRSSLTKKEKNKLNTIYNVQKMVNSIVLFIKNTMFKV